MMLQIIQNNDFTKSPKESLGPIGSPLLQYLRGSGILFFFELFAFTIFLIPFVLSSFPSSSSSFGFFLMSFFFFSLVSFSAIDHFGHYSWGSLMKLEVLMVIPDSSTSYNDSPDFFNDCLVIGLVPWVSINLIRIIQILMALGF